MANSFGEACNFSSASNDFVFTLLCPYSRKLWGLCPEIGSEVVRGSFQVLEGSGGVRRCWGYLLGLFLV